MNLTSAILFATECHKNQQRKYNHLSYIVHPLDVMNELIDCGFYEHEELLMAAVLHDVVEDCNITITDIGNKFGYKTAMFVQDVTKSDLTYRGNTRKDCWNYYINYLRSKSAKSKALKIIDRYCNLKDYTNIWHILDAKQRKFIKNVYIIESKLLVDICDNKEKSVALCNVIFKLNTRITYLESL